MIKTQNKRTQEMIPTQLQNDERIIRVAFSSETPVPRDYDGEIYNEILAHNPDSIDFTRLNNNAAVLWMHDAEQHIGSVVRAWLDTDGVARADIKLTSTELANEKWQMIQDGTLSKISVGYSIDSYRFQGRDLICNWSPYEISFVSIPADDSVGVGRSLDIPEEEQSNVEETPEDSSEINSEERTEVTDESTEQVETDSAEPDETVEVTEQEISTEPTSEETRTLEINALSRTFNVPENIRDSALKTNISVSEFRERILAETLNKTEKENSQFKDEKRDMKINEMINGLVAGNTDGITFGKRGAKIKPEQIRAAVATNTTTAASMITDEVLYDSFVDILRGSSVLSKLPIQVFGGLTSNVSIPVLSDDYSWSIIAEGAAPTDQAANFGSVEFKPQIFAGSCAATKTLLLSSPQSANVISQTMTKSAAAKLETLILTDVATNAPVVTMSGTTYDYGDVVEAIYGLASNGVNMADIVAVCSPDVMAELQQVVVADNTAAKFLLENGMIANLIPAMASSRVPAGTFMIGSFDQYGIGEWEGIELDYDDTTLRSSGGVVFRIFAGIDYHILNTKAFANIKLGAATVQATKK